MVRSLRTSLCIVLAASAVSASGQSRDALDVQKARAQHVTSRAGKVYYTRKFDLSDLPQYRPEQQASGTIRMWGSNYIADSPLMQYWEEGFHKYQPNIQFDTANLKSSFLGSAGLYTGLADISAEGRAFNWFDLMAYERVMNRDPVDVAMATGSYDVTGWTFAFAIFVNKANPISKLTLEQLDRVFGSQRSGAWVKTTWHPELGRGANQNIRTWGQLGLTGEWKDKPIHVYGYSPEYDMALGFAEMAMHSSDKWNEDLREYANFANPDGTIKVAAEAFMADLSKDPYGIAYTGINFRTQETKAIPIARTETGPFVELTIDNVQNRTYPLTREVYLYVDREPGKAVDPKVKEFLRYVLSREGQEAVMRDGKYLPMTREMLEQQLRKID
jgi:phosphate transport system substrate-binding protein